MIQLCCELYITHRIVLRCSYSQNVFLRLYPQEQTTTDLTAWNIEGRLLEVFLCNTAAVAAGGGKKCQGKDIVLLQHEGLREPVACAMFERIIDIDIHDGTVE